ncbi:putative domain XH [Sesbania bispinosa]|nr:putative domain XH [Sesbania bispinosa]
MESIKREHEQITKENEQLSDRIVQLEKQLKSKRNLELENQKQLNDRIVQLEKQLKSKQKLESENQKLKGKLDLMKHMEDEFLKMVGTLHMNITEKEQLLKESEDYNQSLINKERESNDELQKARKRMIEGVAERISRFVNIGVKRMGLVDPRPFLKAMRAKKTYDKEEATQKALEMCSKWEKYVEDPHWYPFKIITVNGRSQEIIDDEDEKLKRVKREVGMGACRAVVVALKEMNEYNASGRFVISELWNYREGKRASLEEGVEFLLGKWKTKKQKIHQMVTQHQEQDPPTSTTTKC